LSFYVSLGNSCEELYKLISLKTSISAGLSISLHLTIPTFVHRDSITAILHELNWPTLQDRRKNIRLMLFFKLVNNLLVALHHYLPLPSFPVTRANHQLKFSHYQARTETYRNSFFPKTTIDWNHLPYPDLHEIDLETFRLYLFN